jgi:glycosyltransferase involved in cell wall biosynthesis
MNITLLSPVGFEEYDYRNPDTVGIGGSETAIREYAWRLSRRGHEVLVYAPTPEDCEPKWMGTTWINPRRSGIDYKKPGTWLLSRCPSELDNFTEDHPNQKLWLVCQDVDYPDQWKEHRLAKIDRIICLCEAHAFHYQMTYPKAAHKVCLGFNGLRLDLVKKIESEGIRLRYPRRLIFASSPDRGLPELLKIFRRCRDWGSGQDGKGAMELFIAYGFDNIEKWIKIGSAPYETKRLMEEVLKDGEQPGVTFMGRTNQPDLYRKRLECGIAPHPTMFTETGFISVIEEMALGCVPVLAPLWAAGEYGQHGIWIQGDPKDQLIQHRWVAEICNLAREEKIQHKLRAGMRAWSQARFNWEWMIDLMEDWMRADSIPKENKELVVAGATA